MGTLDSNTPLQTPARYIAGKLMQEPVKVLDTAVPTAAPDIAYEGNQIMFHDGIIIQVVGEGNVTLYARLREDLPWVAFDTITSDALGVLKNYWGVPLLAVRANSVTTPIQVWVM